MWEKSLMDTVLKKMKERSNCEKGVIRPPS
jgi:hypothetical protein